MAYNPNNANGQGTMANSSPVVLASDQTAVPISDNSGSITVDGSVTVSGTVTANAGTGTQNVSVQNSSIPVTDNGGSLTVDGSVSVSNFPATQPISGTVTANAGSGTFVVGDGGSSLTIDGSVSVSNFPATQAVSSTNLDIRDLTSTDVVTVTGGAGQTADVKITLDSEQVAISNFPATQTVSGTVTANAGTGTFAVSGTVTANAGTGTMNVSVQNASIPVTDNAGSLTVDNNGTFAVQASQSGTWNVGLNAGSNAIGSITNTSFAATQATAANLNATVVGTGTFAVQGSGDVAHDSVDSGNPVKIGGKAIAHGTNPTAVAASDRTDLYANRAGILWTIGGHPNIITRSVVVTDANGAQTDASIVGTIAAGTKVAVTQIAVTVDSATTATGGVSVKMGFGASTIPADSLTGANGILLDHPGIAAGSGMVIGNGSGLIGIGADGEELRLTCEDPIGGNIAITFSYYTIES